MTALAKNGLTRRYFFIIVDILNQKVSYQIIQLLWFYRPGELQLKVFVTIYINLL